MPRTVQDRREDGRKRIPGFVGAEIEFTTPDGKAHRYPLIELSVAGGSWELPNRVPGLEPGVDCGGGVIHVGGLEIGVNLQIRHITRCEGSRYECGARFFPISDDDRNEMAALISRLASLPGQII